MNMEWIPCKWRKLTEEEKELYPDANGIADFSTPVNGQPILTTREFVNRRSNKVCREVVPDECINEGDGLFLDSETDWEDVIAWMPFPQPYDGEDLREVDK